jgi:hypothetical protein
MIETQTLPEKSHAFHVRWMEPVHPSPPNVIDHDKVWHSTTPRCYVVYRKINETI